MSYISVENVDLRLTSEEACGVAYAIKHHLEYQIDSHWKNYPGKFEEREGNLIRIMEGIFGAIGYTGLVVSSRKELMDRLEKASSEEKK